MKTAAGKTIQNGIAIGPLRVCRREETQLCRTSALTPEEEWTRFTAACGEARAQLAELYGKALDRAGRDSAAIFEIHQMLLEDDDYLEAARDLLETQGVSAAYAAIAAGERFAALFSAMEDSYMQHHSSIGPTPQIISFGAFPPICFQASNKKSIPFIFSSLPANTN